MSASEHPAAGAAAAIREREYVPITIDELDVRETDALIEFHSNGVWIAAERTLDLEACR